MVKKMSEKIITTVKAYRSGKPHSKIVTIPKKIRKKLREGNADLLAGKLDDKGRVIYEPIKKELGEKDSAVET